MRIERWRITGLVLLGILFFSSVVFMTEGVTEESVRILVRATARSSVTLFMLAFVASSLHGLIRGRWTAWLLRNRRYIGVSFAVSHFGHLLTLIALGVWFPHPFRDGLGFVTLFGGGLAYVFLAAMTVTSFDGPAKWLGLRRWTLLHTLGSYYIWILFAQSYIPRAFISPFYLPVVIALFAALVLRTMRSIKQRGRIAVTEQAGISVHE